MKTILMKIGVLVVTLAMSPISVLANVDDIAVTKLQQEWAIANYNLSGDKQEAAFESLIERADAMATSHSRSAGVLIWNGIIKSSYAGIKGGLGALGLAKDARDSLEKALKIDPSALNGSAYTTLGTLHSKVPGWPIGFGSDKKAVKLLKKALEMNPDGIDSNYFYADFLLSKKDFGEAEKYLLKAISAPARPERPIADAGRRKEINEALLLARNKQRD